MIQWDTLAALLREYITFQPTFHPNADGFQTDLDWDVLYAKASQMKNMLVGQQYPPEHRKLVGKINCLAGELYEQSPEADLDVAEAALHEIEAILSLSNVSEDAVTNGLTPPAVTNMSQPPSVAGIIAALPPSALTALRRDEAKFVLEILIESDERQTVPEIQNELARRGIRVTEKNLKEILRVLLAEEFLVNPNDKIGYGIAGVHNLK